jgi:hypothetical protein
MSSDFDEHISFLNDLKGDLVRAEANVHRSPVRRRAPLVGAAVAIGIAATVAGVSVILTTHGSVRGGRSAAARSTTVQSRPLPGTSARLLFTPTINHPLPVGKSITLAEAASTLGAAPVMPSDPTANHQNLGTVWGSVTHDENGSTERVVALTFPDSGVILVEQRPVPYVDPATNYANFAAQYPSAHVTSVNGTAALLNSYGAWNSIELVVDGSRLVLEGPASAEELARIAGTLQ